MTYDRYRADDLTLALMYLTLHDEVRVWKGYSWDVLDHLFQQGLITDPRSKAKSVILTEEGLARSRALFQEYLATPAARLPIRAHDARARRHTPSANPSQGSLTELQLAEAAKLLAPLCLPSPDPAVQAQLRIDYRVEGRAIVLFESRPRFSKPEEWGDDPVAKFRYVASRRVWQLFCMHRDLKWHHYELLPESKSLAELVDEVRRDPSGIFWG
jgi:hypothetical protein